MKSLSPCLNLLFRVSASLEADASPLSAILGLFAGFCIVLRGNTFSLPVETRSALSRSIDSRFSMYSHPLLVLAFYMDPFFVPFRQRVGTELWGTETLPAARTRAVSFLCAGEEDLEMQVTRELGGFLRFADGGVAETPSTRLHPSIWWQVHGDDWRTLQFVAVRLLSLPCSSVGSERAFKPLGSLLSRTRNLTMDARVDQQWRIYVNSRQLNRTDALREYTRSATERHLIELVRAGNPGPPAGGGGPAGGGAVPADVPG